MCESRNKNEEDEACKRILNFSTRVCSSIHDKRLEKHDLVKMKSHHVTEKRRSLLEK